MKLRMTLKKASYPVDTDPMKRSCRIHVTKSQNSVGKATKISMP